MVMICRGGPLDDILNELTYGRSPSHGGKHTGGYAPVFDTCRYFALEEHCISAVVSFNEECFRRRNTIVKAQYEKDWLLHHPSITWRLVGYEKKMGKSLEWAARWALDLGREQELFIKGTPRVCSCFDHVDVFMKIRALPRMIPGDSLVGDKVYKDEYGRWFFLRNVGLGEQVKVYCKAWETFINNHAWDVIRVNERIQECTNGNTSLKSHTTVHCRIQKKWKERGWMELTDWSWGNV